MLQLLLDGRGELIAMKRFCPTFHYMPIISRPGDEIVAACLRVGGALSGEHGVGITKSAFLPLEIDQNALSVMRRLKKLFDPNNILNPGKIFEIQ